MHEGGQGRPKRAAFSETLHCSRLAQIWWLHHHLRRRGSFGSSNLGRSATLASSESRPPWAPPSAAAREGLGCRGCTDQHHGPGLARCCRSTNSTYFRYSGGGGAPLHYTQPTTLD